MLLEFLINVFWSLTRTATRLLVKEITSPSKAFARGSASEANLRISDARLLARVDPSLKVYAAAVDDADAGPLLLYEAIDIMAQAKRLGTILMIGALSFSKMIVQLLHLKFVKYIGNSNSNSNRNSWWTSDAVLL